ncbi:hypothetical protein ACTXT7_009345 [Hymenolepis weldensis]
MDSHVKDGQVYFTNGTSFKLCENFVKVDDDAVQRTIIVDLGNGNVEFRDLSSGKKSVYSNVTSGFRLRHNTPRVKPILVWRNVTAMIDTWSGKWAVKFPGSDDFQEVEKIENGIIYTLSGEKVQILLKIKNPKYVLTLEPHWGTVSVYRKSTGHLYGRVSYAPGVISTNTPVGNSILANRVDSPWSPITNFDITMPTESPEKDINKKKYFPAIDLTNGTIYLYDPKRRKVLMDSEVRDGIAHFKNGSTFKICDTFVAFDDPEATVTVVNLTTGDSFLLDRNNAVKIYKSDVFRGFPQQFSSTRTVVAWKNIKVQIDTRSGDWIVQDPESGKLRKAKEIINGKIIMPDGEIIPIQLKIYNKDYSLILEPFVGSIGVYRKSDGELYGKILYNQRGKRDLVKTTAFTSILSTTTVVPLQQTEDLTETILLTDPEKLLAEKITSEDRVAKMVTELKTASDSDSFQESTSFTKLNVAAESSIAQDTDEIDDTEPTAESIKISFGESKISSSDSIFVNAQTTGVKETESQSGSGSDFTSIQDGGGKIVTDVETQSTEFVSGRDTISSTEKTTEISEVKLATTQVEISAEEIVTTRTKIPFSEVTERVQISEVTVFPIVPSDAISFFMTDKTGQVLSSEIQSIGIENIADVVEALISAESGNELTTVLETALDAITTQPENTGSTDIIASTESESTFSHESDPLLSQQKKPTILQVSTSEGLANITEDETTESSSVGFENGRASTEATEISANEFTIENLDKDKMTESELEAKLYTHNKPILFDELSTLLPFPASSSAEVSSIESTTNAGSRIYDLKSQETAYSKDTTEAIQAEISISDYLIGQNLNPDSSVTVVGSATPEIVSNTESMYTQTQGDQTLEVDRDQINSMEGSKYVDSIAVLNTGVTSSSEKGFKEPKGITSDSASTEKILTTSVPFDYEDENINIESKVFGKIVDEISSDTAQVTTEKIVVNSRKSESESHIQFSTAGPSSNSTEDGDVSSMSTVDETSETSSIPISKEMESELTSGTGCVTTEIRIHVESESTTSENEELSEPKSLETSDFNFSSDVKDTNSSESSTFGLKGEDQVSSAESVTTESNSSIKHDSGYETPFDVTEEEIKSNFANEYDSLRSVPTSLPLEISTDKSAEVIMSSEIMTRGSNVDTTTVKDELSKTGKIKSTMETIDRFTSSISLESAGTDVTQESETAPTELSTTDEETNVTTTESEIDSSRFQFWDTLLTTFEMLLKYLTSTANTYQIASATPIQSGDGNTMEVTECFKSEASNTISTPIELISLGSALNNVADGIIASATEQNPNPEPDKPVSTGNINGRGCTTVSSESQDSELITNGQGTSMAITEIDTKVEVGSKTNSKIEITDKEESISTQLEAPLTKNVSETSSTFAQGINSNRVIMDITSTVASVKEFLISSAELPTTEFKNENESKNKSESEIPVLERERQVKLEQIFTEDEDSDNNPLENKGIATETEMVTVQSGAPTTTKKYSFSKQSSLTKIYDLISVGTTETINNAEIATSTRANINDATFKINNLEDFEKPTDKRYTVATTTSSTDKVSEVNNESGFGVFLGTGSSLNEEITGENFTSLPSLDGEQTKTEAIFDPAQSLPSATESRINFVIGSSSEVLTSSDNEMITAELFEETLATNTNIESALSDMNIYTETSLTDSEATDQTVKEMSTTSQLDITEAEKSSGFKDKKTEISADSEQPCVSDTVTKFPSNETKQGVISTETVKEEGVTTISEERRSELSTEYLESVETVINTESPKTAKLAELEKFSESEIHSNDLTGTTNSEAIDGREIATILEAVSIAHESKYRTFTSDVEETDASTEEIQSTDSVDEVLRSDISSEVIEGKMESGEAFTSQDIKPSEVILEAVNMLTEEEETNNSVSVTYEPENSIEFKSDIIMDEIAFTEEVNTKQTSGFIEETENEVTGAGSTSVSMVEADDFETRSEELTTKGILTDETRLSYTSVEITKNDEISSLQPGNKSEESITNPETTEPIETEWEVTPPFQIGTIIQSSDIVALGKSDETEGAVATTDTTVKKQDLVTEVITVAVNLTAQSLHVPVVSSVEAVTESTSATETTATTKVEESGNSSSASETDYKTTDSNSIKEIVTISEIIKVSSTEISNSSSFSPEDVDKLPSPSVESTTSFEESTVHGVFDGSSVSTNSAMDENDDTKSELETQASDSTTGSTLLSKSEMELPNTETVSSSADKSTVITEGSKITIIDDEKVVNMEPKPVEKIRLTTPTDLITENREFIGEFMETTTEKEFIESGETISEVVSSTESKEDRSLSFVFSDSTSAATTEGEVVKTISESDKAISSEMRGSTGVEDTTENPDLSIDAVGKANGDTILGTNDLSDSNFPAQGSTLVAETKATAKTTETEQSVLHSATGSAVTESKFDSGEVFVTAEMSEEILVTGKPKFAGVATEESVSTETEANDNTIQLLIDSKATQIEHIESIEGNTSTESNHITETVVTAFSSDKQSTKSTISEIERMVTSSYEVETTYERFSKSKSTIFNEKPTGASSTESGASELTSSSSESFFEAEVSSMSVKPITVDEFNKISDANSHVETTGGFERSECISTSSNIELISNSETGAIAKNSATEEMKPNIETCTETLSTAIDKKLAISTDEIRYELDSSLKTETTFKDLGEKSAETSTSATEIDGISPTIEENLSKSSESVEVEDTGDTTSVTNNFIPDIESTPEVENETMEENSLSPEITEGTKASLDLNTASSTITEKEESLSGNSAAETISTGEDFAIEATGEAESTTIETKITKSNEVLGKGSVSISETETGSENLGKMNFEDFEDKSTKSPPTESEMDVISSTLEEGLSKSSESVEFETTSGTISELTYITPDINLTLEAETEIIKENFRSLVTYGGAEISPEPNKAPYTITEILEMLSSSSGAEAMFTTENLNIEATDELVSIATAEKLTTSRDEIESELTSSSEAVTSSEMTAEDIGDKYTGTVSIKSEMCATSSFIIEDTSRASEYMEMGANSEKTSDSANKTELTQEAETNTTKENFESSKTTGGGEISPNLNADAEISVDLTPTVETNGKLSSETSIGSSTAAEIEDMSSITTSKTEIISSKTSEIGKAVESTEGSIPEFNSLETDISAIEVTLESTDVTPSKMVEIAESSESIESDITFSPKLIISSSETEHGSDSSDLSSAFPSSVAPSVKETKIGMTYTESSISSGTTGVDTTCLEPNIQAREGEGTDLVPETQDSADSSNAIPALPNSDPTKNLEQTELSTVREPGSITNSPGLSIDMSKLEDETVVSELLSSSESLELSSTTPAAEVTSLVKDQVTESFQEVAETSEMSSTKEAEETFFESVRIIGTTEDKQTVATEVVESNDSTEVIDDENKATEKRVGDLILPLVTEGINKNYGSSLIGPDTEITSTADQIIDEMAYQEGVESSDPRLTEEIGETMLGTIATNAVWFTSSESGNDIAEVISSNTEKTTTVEPIVGNESGVGSESMVSKIIENALSTTDLGVDEEEILPSSQIDSTSEKPLSTFTLPASGPDCNPKVIMFCQMLSRAIIASGLQVEDDDDTFTTTTTTEEGTTTEESTTTSIPNMTISADNENQSTAEISSDNAISSLSTIISFTSDSIGKVEQGYLIPIVDLSDMAVRIFNTKENRIIKNAFIENGYLQFENGTSILIQDVQGISPPEKTANNVLISVDLDDETTSLVDLEAGNVIMSRRSSEGIPREVMRNYSEGALFEILSGNTIIQVDTFNGRWTVQDASTGNIHLVQEVKDGILYLANGDEISLPTTGNDAETIAIDGINGIVRAINKKTGEVRIILPPTEEPEILPDETTQEKIEESTTLTTVESIPMTEIVTEVEVTKIPNVSDTAEIATIPPSGESLTDSNEDQEDRSTENTETSTTLESIETVISSEEQRDSITEITGIQDGDTPDTSTVESDIYITIPPSSDSLTDSDEDQEDRSTESSTSIDTETSTTLESTETVISSEEQRDSITETTGIQDGDTSDTPYTELDDNENAASNEEDSAGVSESKSDINKEVESETTPITSSGDKDSIATEPDEISADYFTSQTNDSATIDASEILSDPFTEQPKTEISTESENNTETVGSESASESPEVIPDTTTVDAITTEGENARDEEVGEERPNRSIATQVEEGELTDFPAVSIPSTVKSPQFCESSAHFDVLLLTLLQFQLAIENQSPQEILRPDCACLEKLLTPELVQKFRENNIKNPDAKDEIYDNLFGTPSFLRVVREVIDEYFERPGVPERYKPNCSCPVNNCSCPTPEPPPPYNVTSSSQHILGVLKDMSNGAIILNNKTSLMKIAGSLAIGSMVYLNEEDMFYLKNTQSESVRIPDPAPTITTTVKPSLADHLVGRSLLLIGHNDPLNGQLRFGAKLSGGHSSAILACQRAARRYNVSHIFYPLMNTDMFNMDYVVPPMYRYDMPIINLRGEIIFDDFMHMVNGQQAPMATIYTFAGKELNSDPTVPCAWIGAKPIYVNGDYEFAARWKCRNWQSREPTDTGLAVHIPMNSNATAFLDQSNLYNESCAKRCSIICIQISPN